MSRVFDARQAALAQTGDRETAIDIFVGYLDADKCDIEHELGMSCEEYIFGAVNKGKKPCLNCRNEHRHNNSFCSPECCKSFRGKDK